MGGRSIWVLREAVIMENDHDDPINYFRIRTKDAPDDSVGVIHSHPVHRPEPSDNDLDGIPAGWIGAVLSNGDVAWYVKSRPVRPHLRPI
jgi:proteasome lid subunit RPN8/RPN11